ncbi:MAG: PIN domain-containing protein [Candidatus Hodarchaeales archaeon]
MDRKVFIDTNIFVYASLQDKEDIERREKVIALLQGLTEQVIISTQVINEFYVVLLKNGISDKVVQEKVQEIMYEATVQIVDLETIRKAWKIKEKYLCSYWDSLIIASALDSGCEILYSEDMQHRQVIEDTLKIVNPFIE